MGASVCFLLLRKVKRRGKVDSFFGTRAHKSKAPAGTGAKENTMNDRQTITLDDTDKLNQEYALWLAAGVSPELLTPPTDRDHWRFCIEHIRIDGVAYEVLIDHDDDFGTRVQVVRPERTTTGQQIGVECPRCAEDTDWTCDSVPDGSFVIRCQSCDTAFPLVAGVPPEHKGAK